jgi:CDP-diglyceride synthetase
MSELRQRVMVSVIFIPLLLAALWLGGGYLIAMFSLVSILGGFEYFTMMRGKGHRVAWIWLAWVPRFSGPADLESTLTCVAHGWRCALIMDAIMVWDEKHVVRGVFPSASPYVPAFLPALITRIGLDYLGRPILLSLVMMIWIVEAWPTSWD